MLLPASVQVGLPPEPSYHPGSAGPSRMVPIMAPQLLGIEERRREALKLSHAIRDPDVQRGIGGAGRERGRVNLG